MAEANLRAVESGVVRRRQEFRLGLVVLALQALLVFVIPVVFFRILTTTCPCSSNVYYH